MLKISSIIDGLLCVILFGVLIPVYYIIETQPVKEEVIVTPFKTYKVIDNGEYILTDFESKDTMDILRFNTDNFIPSEVIKEDCIPVKVSTITTTNIFGYDMFLSSKDAIQCK